MTLDNESVKESEDQAAQRKESKYVARATTPMKAIRAKCVQCQGGEVRAVNKCQEKTCALWQFRTGFKDPNKVFRRRKK